MNKFVRIVAEPTIDNPDTPPLYLDVVIDSEDSIVGRNAIFSFQGETSTRHGRSLPFILYSDGRADFGEGWPAEDRYGNLDLREGKVVQGRLLRFRGDGYDERFRITEIVILAEDSLPDSGSL